MTGTTDMRIAFHPHGLSVCLNEKAEDPKKTGMGLIPILKTHFSYPRNPPNLGSMGMGLGMKPNLI